MTVLASQSVVKTKMLELCSGTLEAGSDIFAEGSARPVGKVAAVSDHAAVAVLRLQSAFGDKPLRAGTPEGPAVKPHRPSWWPPEWGNEAQEP